MSIQMTSEMPSGKRIYFARIQTLVTFKDNEGNEDPDVPYGCNDMVEAESEEEARKLLLAKYEKNSPGKVSIASIEDITDQKDAVDFYRMITLSAEGKDEEADAIVAKLFGIDEED